MTCANCGASVADGARFCPECGTRVAPGVSSSDRLRQLLELAVGTHYRIEREIGRGGMGVVYLAHESGLERRVAIKVLPPDKAQLEQYRERFRREARSVARLSHANVVPLHSFGEHDGMLYYVMGYVDGESLAERMQREGRLPEAEARRILVALAEALHHAHQQGIVHRDVKPQNVLLERSSGRPLLTDFGISRLADSSGLTSLGTLVGTPEYMSPEQAAGGEVGPASDLYSLGLVGYAMVSGRLPFAAKTPGQAIASRLTADPPPLPSGRSCADPALCAAIMRCLERDPKKRWPDAASFARAVGQVEDPDTNPPAELVALEGRGLGLLVMAALALLTQTWVARTSSSLAVGAALAAVLAVALLGIGFLWLRARRAGQGNAAVLRALLLEPAFWTTWYPSALRRHANVWDRLPFPVRRARLAAGVVYLHLGLLTFATVGMMRLVVDASDSYPLRLTWGLLGGALWLTVLLLLQFVVLATGGLCAQGLSETEARRVAYSAPLSMRAFWMQPAIASVLGGAVPGPVQVPLPPVPPDGGATQQDTATLEQPAAGRASAERRPD